MAVLFSASELMVLSIGFGNPLTNRECVLLPHTPRGLKPLQGFCCLLQIGDHTIYYLCYRSYKNIGFQNHTRILPIYINRSASYRHGHSS
jgi:hypothetical protein